MSNGLRGMNYDEFAFFNQQLAGMLRTGIPLEGALAQLCRRMRSRKLKAELEIVGAQLREGVPLHRAVENRKLPRAYIEMLRAGAQSESLPSILILVADYYGKLHNITTRLKGLMVYPIIILTCSLALSTFLSLTYWAALQSVVDPGTAIPNYGPAGVIFWMPTLAFLSMLILFSGFFLNQRARQWLRWRLPGIKDASLAQNASTISILLSAGAHLDTTLSLVQETEQNSLAAKDIEKWRANVREGKAKFPEMAQQSKVYPPLFLWLVAQCGEDLARGFARAADIYGERAQSRTDMLLYAALPLAVVVLGVMILGQTISVVSLLTRAISAF